jgi:hypothetical protein
MARPKKSAAKAPAKFQTRTTPTGRDENEEAVTAGIWTTPATDTGKQTPKLLPQDDQMRKELVEEGVDEAEHDQMRQAARRQRKKES